MQNSQNKIQYKTFSPEEFLNFSKNLKKNQKIISPTQTHSDNIIEIITGEENLENCDGIWTHTSPLDKGALGDFLTIKTADCAPIVFISENKFGVIHAGWRGLCGNIIENMLEIFSEKDSQNKNLKIWVGPILPKFEIQKDFCYDQMKSKFGENFFEIKNSVGIDLSVCQNKKIDYKIIFNFKEALASILPKNTIFDERNTLEEKNLASFRENKTTKRNITVVGKNIL